MLPAAFTQKRVKQLHEIWFGTGCGLDMTEKMLCCRNKMLPFSAWTSSRTSRSVSNSLSPLIHRVGNTAAPLYPLQSQGPVFHTTHCSQSSRSVPRHAGTHHAFNSSVLLKISLLPSLPQLSCLSFFGLLLKLLPGLDLKENSSFWLLIAIAKTTSLNTLFLLFYLFFPHSVLLSWLQLTLSIFLSIVTTLVSHQQEDWGRTHFPSLWNVKRCRRKNTKLVRAEPLVTEL